MSLFTSCPPAEDPAQASPPTRGAGTLRIHCTQREVRRRLHESLTRAGAAPRRDGDDAIAVRTDDVDALALELCGDISADERADARASFSPEGDAASPPAPQRLCCLLRDAQERWVAGLLRPGGLTAVFQPIVRCGRSEVFGFEALMRADGEAAPFDAARLFAAAREAGLARRLDRHACRTAVSEAARHGVSTKLFVNVTPSSLCGAARGADGAVRALEDLRLSPHQIVFELVEGEPVADWRRLREALGRYRERGFQFALDDFGAAYSSPVTLCELRPDYVKLDRALVSGVDRDACRARVTSKLVEAARAFGARVVAEGVETAGEYGWVLARGVEFAQGFYISRPAAPPPFMRAA